MNIREAYQYLTKARAELFSTLGKAGDSALSRSLLTDTDNKCIKDFLVHIACVEDGWLNEDILRRPSVFQATPALQLASMEEGYGSLPLEEIIEYWKRVESGTLAYLDSLTSEELDRTVSLHDEPERKYGLDGLLWHVVLHEIRHTAQIVLLLRLQGIKPPSLDLLFFLPAR